MNKYISLILASTLALALTFILGCSEKCGEAKYDPEKQFCYNNRDIANKCADNEYNPETQFCDSRNNRVYKYAKIGEQVWMAENLNMELGGSKCYGEGLKAEIGESDKKGLIYRTLTAEEMQANCEKYGRLYNWEAAIKACPEGWHLPSVTEWNVLANFSGGTRGRYDAGKILKAKDGWNYKDKSGNGTDDYGFAALPGGHTEGSNYNYIGREGLWWSATDRDPTYVYHYKIILDRESAETSKQEKNVLSSIRCIQNSTVSAVFEKCGNEEYDTYNKFCVDNAVYYRCGNTEDKSGEEYNPATQFCNYARDIISDKCNGKEYMSGEGYQEGYQDCIDGKIVDICGGEQYDPKTHFCACTTPCWVEELCGGKSYNAACETCDNGKVKYVGCQTADAD